MPRQQINVGTTANDGTGDTLRASQQKAEANFIELYAASGGSSQDLQAVLIVGNTYTVGDYTLTIYASGIGFVNNVTGAENFLSNGVLQLGKSGGEFATIQADNLDSIVVQQLPNANGTYGLSVNGVPFDVNGNVAVAGGAGTVTEITGTDGVTVALGTSTPVIGLGDIAPNSVAAVGTVSGENISAASVLSGQSLYINGGAAEIKTANTVIIGDSDNTTKILILGSAAGDTVEIISGNATQITAGTRIDLTATNEVQVVAPSFTVNGEEVATQPYVTSAIAAIPLQTITLLGAVTGSGTAGFATTLASGIDAAKIADGSVSNAEFQRINSLTSDAQTQLNAKAPIASPTFTGTITLPNGGLAITGGSAISYIKGNGTTATLATDVRATVLTGLSIGTNTAVAAADTILAAIGKLQAQTTLAGSYTSAATAVSTFTVTIGSTMANVTYKVVASPSNTLSAASFYITNKTTTSFDVMYLTALTGAIAFDWLLKP